MNSSKIAVYNDRQIQLMRIIDKYPDVCPVCKKGGQPLYCYGFLHEGDSGKEMLQLVFRCPLHQCESLYISYYSEGYGGSLNLQESFHIPYFSKETFSEEISAISPIFVEIYNEAFIAEGNNLNYIAGPGYRKALEFLVKDYLIAKLFKEDLETIKLIKFEQLAPSINRINDEHIKEMASRAAWVGNDETHYVRKWVDKDIEDFKKLIRLVTHFIESHEMYESFKFEMPQGKK